MKGVRLVIGNNITDIETVQVIAEGEGMEFGFAAHEVLQFLDQQVVFTVDVEEILEEIEDDEDYDPPEAFYSMN